MPSKLDRFIEAAENGQTYDDVKYTLAGELTLLYEAAGFDISEMRTREDLRAAATATMVALRDARKAFEGLPR